MPKFDGSDYSSELDDVRLTKQITRIFSAMRDGVWRTLEEISTLTGDPPASISAQLRHLRKACFGGHTVNKLPRGAREDGLYEYQLVVNTHPISEDDKRKARTFWLVKCDGVAGEGYSKRDRAEERFTELNKDGKYELIECREIISSARG